MNPQVSIIIPARNEAANMARCLEAINSQETSRSFEVIVIDSGSTDGTGEIAARHGAKVITIAAREFDHGRTRNLGLSNARGEYLITLVADAVPADKRWLEALIAPLEADPKVAGAYSRQIPPPGTHPLETRRILDRFTAGDEPIISEWPGDAAWEALDPEQRMYLANFDDVSAVRRRSVWQKIPIAENYWGEDLDWSLKALRTGYRIAFAPLSSVLHAHRPALAHSFRRAYVDQAVVKRMFGVTYYTNMSEFCAGLLELIRRDDAILKSSDLGTSERIKWRLINPLRRLMETTGAHLAASVAREQHVASSHKQYRNLYVFLWRMKKSGDVLRTSFTINGVRRNVLFAHPPANVRFKMRVPPDAKIEFYPAINPEVWNKAGPVTFEVAVNGLRVYEEEIHPAVNPDYRAWCPRTVDLSRWFNSRIDIELITRAKNTDNAWAGWGEPRIVAIRESFMAGLRRKALERIDRAIYSRPMRHP